MLGRLRTVLLSPRSGGGLGGDLVVRSGSALGGGLVARSSSRLGGDLVARPGSGLGGDLIGRSSSGLDLIALVGTEGTGSNTSGTHRVSKVEL